MRVTNSMMTNRMLLNMHRNMALLDEYNQQLASTKRINVPSDDPILAARALKFRTSVSETEQYQRNVKQGLSWMSTTDKAFLNITSIITHARTLLNNGATGSNIYDDRAAIAANIEQLMQQVGKEMNATYAGRYVFSGYRTDHPPLYERANDKAFNISQTFVGSDVELTKALVKVSDPTYGNTEAAVPSDVALLKLAYKGTGTPTVTIGGVAQTVTPKLLNDTTAYTPADNEIIFIAQTGELVLGKDAYAAVQTQEMAVSYDKTGFVEGDLNPVVYFDCTEYQSAAAATETLDAAAPPAALANGNILSPVTVTIGAKTYTATASSPLGAPAAGEILYDPATGDIAYGADIQTELTALGAGGTFTVSYTHQGTPPLNKDYTMDGQVLEYEFGINTRIGINSLAKDVYTAQFYADMRDFVEFVRSVELSDENQLRNKLTTENPAWSSEEIEEAVTKQMTREKQEMETALYDRYNNMLGMIDKHFRTVSTQETDLGSRMSRLELIETRLDADLTNYKELLSENEDTDMVTTAIKMSTAKAAYDASLKVGASIIQMTLADYIR